MELGLCKCDMEEKKYKKNKSEKKVLFRHDKEKRLLQEPMRGASAVPVICARVSSPVRGGTVEEQQWCSSDFPEHMPFL